MPASQPLAITLSAGAAAALTRLAADAREDYLALHQAVAAVADARGLHADAEALRRTGAVTEYRLAVGRNVLRYAVDLGERVVTVRDVTAR